MDDKRRKISLVSLTSASTDTIGQTVGSESSTDVYCTLRSVSLGEWTDAGQLGLSAQYQAVIWAKEYSGQEIVDIGERRYHVYRTYETGRHVELYLEEMVGHAG